MICIMKSHLKYVADSGKIVEIENPEESKFWAQSLELDHGGQSWCLHLPGTYNLIRMFVGNQHIGFKLQYPVTDNSPQYLRRVQVGDNIVVTAGQESVHDISLWRGASKLEIILLNNKVSRYQVV
jgi:hypothetical protein